MSKIPLVFLSVLIVASFIFISTTISALVFRVDFSGPKTADLPASTFFVDSITEKSLKNTYAKAKNGGAKARNVRILVVPGHDRQSWGTQFQGLKEIELNLEVGEELFRLLGQEPLFDVFISQTKNGYDPEFLSYFEKNRNEVVDFVEKQKGLMNKFLSTGEIHSTVNVIHNDAPNEVALKLYGINKWANENEIDIVIHIHFNDYPGRRASQPGKYSGFSIYVPESQYSNARGSKPPAESVHDRLANFYAQSNLPIEDGGVVEDQELIAVGSNNTLDGAAMLIEYGYIYESAFTDPALRSIVLSDLALQTYLGIVDFFEDGGEGVETGGLHQTNFLPHKWESDLADGDGESGAGRDVLSLQTALTLEGLYPPPAKLKNDCGLTGYFGPCTEKSVRAFQEKYGIYPAEGFVGEKTRAKLNEIYGTTIF